MTSEMQFFNRVGARRRVARRSVLTQLALCGFALTLTAWVPQRLFGQNPPPTLNILPYFIDFTTCGSLPPGSYGLCNSLFLGTNNAPNSTYTPGTTAYNDQFAGLLSAYTDLDLNGGPNCPNLPANYCPVYISPLGGPVVVGIPPIIPGSSPPTQWVPGPTYPFTLSVSGQAYLSSTVNIGSTATCTGGSATCMLSVAGGIHAQEVIVNSTGSDYVFDPSYRLQPLSEVAAYIGKNHHLPDIPSAEKVQKDGVSLGDMQTKLLAKIEELTLHMIQAEDENKKLRERIERLETEASHVPKN